MAYKEREFICKFCRNKFLSRKKDPSTCSKECKIKFMGKTLKVEKIGICEWCRKEFKYITSKRHPVHRFCSQDCRYKNNVDNIKKNGLSDKTKKKISNSLMNISLKDRGFTDNAIENSISALKKAGKKWNDSIKNKTYEEIHGKEKAQLLKKKFSEDRKGDKNSFFGKHHSIETKNKIVKNRKGKFYNFASGLFNDIKWQGSYELGFLIYCYENKIGVKRYNIDPIKYFYLNKRHHYYPDFIIDDIVIECKGYSDAQNNAKIKSGYKALGDKYKVIRKNSKELKELPNRKINLWYKKMEEKYRNILVIKHNPHMNEEV